MAEGLKGNWDDPIYKQLAQRLDTVPNGYPATDSGVELKLLAKLFTPEEAALALKLTLTPESADQIAKRIGGDPQDLEVALSGMAERGLIHEKRRKEGVSYALIPFVVGIYELQLENMDEELARIFEEYYKEGFHKLLDLEPPVQRVIPVEQNVPGDTEVMPYELASELLGEAQSWGVMDCICRKQRKLIGEGCDHPMDVCMIFSRRPGTFDESRTIKAITKEEALEVLKRSEEAGLVHTVGNTQRGVYYVCNCCSCSCAILRGISEYGLLSATAPSSFMASVDEDLCTGCELCLERCQFNAIYVDDNLCHVDQRRCFGCGLCITTCPDEAISLISRPAAQMPVPPESMPDWMRDRAGLREIDPKQLEDVIGKLA
ncbi:MAG: 4Fe-4S binding protein [Dehalococcoidia bacterium]|nr:MAG: 4Fe-4S binding protein [Dehalococcoidia bacterium]